MTTLRQLKEQIVSDTSHWAIYLMDFVDDFRYYQKIETINDPFEPTHERWDALLASTAEYLCDELHLSAPSWLAEINACHTPWFVSGIERLKAIALAESPLRFRIRKIFVLENFLSRA